VENSRRTDRQSRRRLGPRGGHDSQEVTAKRRPLYPANPARGSIKYETRYRNVGQTFLRCADRGLPRSQSIMKTVRYFRKYIGLITGEEVDGRSDWRVIVP
jgi:hypothetical protein